MALTPDNILSGIRIGAAMSGILLPEEIATRALLLGIMLDQRAPLLAAQVLALLPEQDTADLRTLMDAMVETNHAV